VRGGKRERKEKKDRGGKRDREEYRVIGGKSWKGEKRRKQGESKQRGGAGTAVKEGIRWGG
jgi:hypothetical protein